MKRNLFFLPSALLALAFSERGDAQGSLVSNGGFDFGAAGWISTNINRFGGWYPNKGNPDGYFFLDAVPSGQPPTISQALKGLAPGFTYLVSGDYFYSDNSGDPAVATSFGVALNGVFLFETVKPASPDWQTFSFLYSPSVSDQILSMSAQLNGTTVSYGIDNITVQLIPEPSSMALLVLTGASILGWHWRRKLKSEAQKSRQP